MTVKDLMNELAQCDPHAVVVDSHTYHPLCRLEELPWFYDGRAWVYDTDDEGRVQKVRHNTSVPKVVLFSHETEEILLDAPEMPFEDSRTHEDALGPSHELREAGRQFWREHPEWEPDTVRYLYSAGKDAQDG